MGLSELTIISWCGLRGIVTIAAACTLRDEFVTTEVLESDSPFSTTREARNHLRGRVVEAQRQMLVRSRDAGEIGDDAFQAIEERLDWIEVVAR